MRDLVGAEILVATGNDGKRAEFAALLAPYGVRLRTLADFALSEPEESEPSFAGNAVLKARAAARQSGLVSISDDSGLVVQALGGAPGIYTADWAETGQGRDFGLAMAKTWDLLLAVRSPEPRLAEFCCTLAVAWPDVDVRVYEGQLRGQVVWPPRGRLGHGYDPIFQPEGRDETMGELAPEAKNQISHRADAARKLILDCFT